MPLGCAKSDRAVMDQSQSLIDQRKYGAAISLLEKQPEHHQNAKTKTQLAYAYLGQSGVELMEVAKQVDFYKKSLQSDPHFLTKTCSGAIIESIKHSIFDCLPLVKIPKFPEPDNPSLLKALGIFNELYPDPTTTHQDINFLLAVIHMSIAVKNYEQFTTAALKLKNKDLIPSREAQIEAASYGIKYFKRTMDSVFVSFHRLLFSYGKIKGFFNRFKDKPLLRIGTYTYYGTDKLSADDFLQFLLQSAHQDINRKAHQLSNKKDSLDHFSQSLEDGLYWMAAPLFGNAQNLMNDTIFSSVYLGARLFPKKFNLYQNINSTQLSFDPSQFKFDIQSDLLPKSTLRFIQSVRSAWIHENAEFIFAELDDFHEQATLAQQLEDSWVAFQHSPGTSEIEFPTFVAPPGNAPDLQSVKNWYQNASDQLFAWNTRIKDQTNVGTTGSNLNALLDQTQHWIEYNLWSHP